MNTLLLRLVGPMQSWGVQSRFSVRDTGLEPSKSGVIGLLCAALGQNRDAPVNDLAALRMGVRVDREGRLSRDYHTAQNVLKAGVSGLKATELSTRYYLADAAFLVGLESDVPVLLEDLQNALLHPVWPLYLGRKAFVPGEPIALLDGLKICASLVDALAAYPYLGLNAPTERLRLVIENPHGDLVRPDQPVSFQKGNRRFTPRWLSVTFIGHLNLPALEVP